MTPPTSHATDEHGNHAPVAEVDPTTAYPNADQPPTASLNTTIDDSTAVSSSTDVTEPETAPDELTEDDEQVAGSTQSDEAFEVSVAGPESDEVAGEAEVDTHGDEQARPDASGTDRHVLDESTPTEVSASEPEWDEAGVGEAEVGSLGDEQVRSEVSGTDHDALDESTLSKTSAVEPEGEPGTGGDGWTRSDEEGGTREQTEIDVEEVIDDVTMRRAVEAILMVTDEPLAAVTLARAVGRATNDVAEALTSLATEYAEQGRGFDLREVAGGWRYYTREDAAPYVERFVLDGQQARLTQASLETLAVIAYKQPVSRARVSAIRGVNVDGVVRTLVTRGLVEEAGTDTESQATLYRTTSYFLERMGMQSLEDLPELAPYLPDMDDVEDELTQQAAPPETEPEPEPEQPKDE